MLAATLRVRIDRRTGETISREVIETFEMTEDEYTTRLVWALTGKSPEDAARHIREVMMAMPVDKPRAKRGPAANEPPSA